MRFKIIPKIRMLKKSLTQIRKRNRPPLPRINQLHKLLHINTRINIPNHRLQLRKINHAILVLINPSKLFMKCKYFLVMFLDVVV